MKCLLYFGITSMKEDTSAHLSGRGELHGGARVITLVTLKNVLKASKKCLSVSLNTFPRIRGGLAWIRPWKGGLFNIPQMGRRTANLHQKPAKVAGTPFVIRQIRVPRSNSHIP